MDNFEYIAENIRKIRFRIIKACEKSNRNPNDVILIAVTKYTSTEAIKAAYNFGLRNFGENKVQDANNKIKELSTSIQPIWHMIGHLQTNKVKLATEIFNIIHGVDSIKLAEELNRHVTNKLPVLIQVNIAEEFTKSGFSVDEFTKSIDRICKLPNLDVSGLMTIAPIVNSREETRPIFRKLRELSSCYGIKQLSMGMTDDFEIAVEEGATMVRIGRAIFEKNET
ncbi:MAG: YggS family pyridoxal phosphate-dependent enzyme [Chloroflexi bacterium]|nr:YggS family pyridoxal phosphate-dependent enzyme [Chloroflexota bacterium]